MDLQTLTYIVVGLSFALYIGIAFWSKARTTGDFYVAGKHVHPVANGMATAADWMSAASFISLAGLIAYLGYDSSVYLMGWTGGYVLLALLLAPYLRRFGKFTVPEFIGERYYSDAARVVAVICLIVISFTYVAGQMRGVGIVFSRFLGVDISVGLAVGMGVVFLYAVLGGMKGITYTQVAQYCVLIFAYTVPAVFISLQVTGVAVPQVAFGSDVVNGGGNLLTTLDGIVTDLGFTAFTAGAKDTVDVFFITLALMIGTAGLPHVLVRFFTVPKVRHARVSAGYALLFIAILYTTAPAVGALARLNLTTTIQTGPVFEENANLAYEDRPGWFRTWEDTGLLLLRGPERRRPDPVLQRRQPRFLAACGRERLARKRIDGGPRHHRARQPRNRRPAELGDRAGCGRRHRRGPVHGRGPAAGHIGRGIARPDQERVRAQHFRTGRTEGRPHKRRAGGPAGRLPGLQPAGIRGGSGGAGLRPGGRIAVPRHPARDSLIARQQAGSDCRHAVGSALHDGLHHLVQGVFVEPFAANVPENWLFGVSPEGIGAVGAALNLSVALAVSALTPAPPEPVQALVRRIRVPSGSGG